MVTTSVKKSASEIVSGSTNYTIGIKEDMDQVELKKLPTYNRLDSFERCAEVTELLCECYPDYRVIKGMPKGLFSDKFGGDMIKDVAKCMSDFYAGKMSQNEVADFFEECCTSMRIYRTKQRQTSGTNPEDNQRIVGCIYEIFAKENQRAACRANYNEGEAFNNEYGGLKSDWVYYNSEYYYRCEDEKEVLREIVDGVTSKWGLPAINPDEIEANSDFTLDGAFDFNSGWNFEFRNLSGRGSIEDESVEPPKNFVFFYKEQSSCGKGYLSVLLNNCKYNEDVPFYISKTGGLKGQIFSLYDLLSGDLGNNKEYNCFLRNITVFTRMYSFCSGINNQAGNYVPRWN